MFELWAIKSAAALATKNAVATIMWAIPFAFIIAIFPEIKIDLAFYGVMGGLTRWIAAKCDWKDGLGGLVVGVLMALGFEGFTVPFLKDLVTGNEQLAHCSSYAYGLIGNIIFDWVVSFAKTRAKS